MRSVANRTPIRVALASPFALASLLALVVLASAASPAGAKPWGELKEFKPSKLTGEAERLEEWPSKFAAGPNGTYYVLLQGEFEKKIILQRYHEGDLQAETQIEPPKVSAKDENENATEASNAAIAVDPNPKNEPGRERVYVLFVYERRGQNPSEENDEQYPLDSEMQALGSLYAFEYKSSGGGELVSAKTEKNKPAPALTREAMHSEAEEEHGAGTELNPSERPLLDPRGMAVDPATGDLAISGNEDEAPMERVQKGEEEKQCRAALQFVKTSGGSGQLELSLGARYVDKQAKLLSGQPLTHQPETGCGNAEEGERGVEQAPASPVFAPDGSVLGFSEEREVGELELEPGIWQLAGPLSQAQEEAAGKVEEMTPKQLFLPTSIEPWESFSGREQPTSMMSLVPTSATEGTIYLSGVYGYFGKQPAPSVLHYSHPSGGEPSIAEVGWIGGAKENEFLGTAPCNIHPYPNDEPTMLGGLTGGGFLALAFYEEETASHEPQGKYFAEVLEFGEGGKTEGCPTVPVSTPVATYQGEPKQQVEAGSALTITSVLGKVEPNGATRAAAAAKSVTWTVKFTSPEGAHEETSYPVSYEKALPSEVTLDYTPGKAGTYEISDKVQTDDLADEAAQSETSKLTVTPGGLKVQLRSPEPSEVHAGEGEATLTAEVHGEEKTHLKKVAWEFGENAKDEEASSQELPATLQVKHVFNRCATVKCKIIVTVEAETASHSVEKASGQVEITVRPSKAEEEKENEKSPGGGGGPPPPPPPPPPGGGPTAKGGVEAYIASFSGSSLSVSSSGAVPVKVTCPSGGSCSGTLTLQTASAVATSHKKHAKKKFLTLASGSFSLTAGSRSVTLHLSAAARSLLSHSHGALRAKLTILSRGVGGQKNSTSTHVLTLRLVKPHKKSHKR
ncbi:MAG TPA: hypothetical protein VMB51_14530 [Solirubrobacteraceae bacterium]|nr:hypothetical protein [Solirubrobacteraceae bacterium]